MSQSAYRTAPHAREADIIGRKALEFLSIHHLDLTPSNYELIYEVLRGRDKALREAFVALPKPVSQAALSTLAHTFIRKLPLVANLRSASDDALAALTIAYCVLPCVLKLGAVALLYFTWIRPAGRTAS